MSAKATTRAHLATLTGPFVYIRGTSSEARILYIEETIDESESVEITANCKGNVTAFPVGASFAIAQVYCFSEESSTITPSGHFSRFYDVSGSPDGVQKFVSLAGLIRGSDIGAGTFRFGIAVFLNQTGGSPQIAVDIEEVNLRVTVLAL